jgi:hypothetical protein
VTIVITVFAFVLSTRAIAGHVFKFSMAWRPLGKPASRRSATSASGASRRSLDPFAVRPGRRASSQMSWRVTTGLPIPWSSCSGTRPIFAQLVAMGASWPTSFRWPQRESLAGGSVGCLQGPSHLGGISASASSTGTHPWDPSQRVRRPTSPLMASSHGA